MKMIYLRRYRTFIIIIVLFISLYLLYFCINLSAKALYPDQYRGIINKYSKDYELDPWLVTAIIRVESKFDKTAVSRKGARGLMQIASITGKWAADELNINNYSEDMLFTPEINIRIGCWYLNKLRDQFKNDIVLMLAAYNGGSGNVSKWLKDYRYSSDGVNLETIPFKETREYIVKVDRNFKIYKYIYDRKKDSIFYLLLNNMAISYIINLTFTYQSS